MRDRNVFPLKSYEDSEEVAMSDLAHYGVKGMKWGVRRTDAQLARASSVRSDDAKAAAATRAKIKKHGVESLSNKEMNQLLERMNLENRYSAMVQGPQTKSTLDRGHDATKKVLKVAKTVEDVRKFMNTPTGKVIVTGLKVGAAAYTGGASAAAGTAVSTGLALARNR